MYKFYLNNIWKEAKKNFNGSKSILIVSTRTNKFFGNMNYFFGGARLGFAGNQPFSTRLVCSKISSIDQKQEKPITPITVDSRISLIIIDKTIKANPVIKKNHQHFVPR